jgi:hypothetical protein
MKNRLEFIMFSVMGRAFGIDTAEIVKVISRRSMTAFEFAAAMEPGEGGTAGRFGDLIGSHDPLPHDTLLIVKGSDAGDALIAVPGEVDCVGIDSAELIPVPEYLKKRQDPFFVWAFIRMDRRLVSCVTFCDFKWEKQL